MKHLTPELLSDVLGEKVYDIKEDNDTNIVWYEGEGIQPLSDKPMPDWKKLNLDTLCRLCKEWCMKQGYQIMSGTRITIVLYSYDISLDNIAKKFIHEDTELEAVLKATEWVRSHK